MTFNTAKKRCVKSLANHYGYKARRLNAMMLTLYIMLLPFNNKNNIIIAIIESMAAPKQASYISLV
jgi:hypothetical protein